MRSVAWWLGAAALIATGCPPRRSPDAPLPGVAAGGSDDAGGAATGLPGGPVNADEAAAQLLPVQARPGEAVIVLHCAFPDAWATAVPLAVADEAGDYLVQAVVALGSFQPIARDMPGRGQLAPYAAQSCAPDLVLHVAPGTWQLVVGRRDRLVAPVGRAAGWMDTADVAAGDRLEYYLGAEDTTLDVPCR